jgi:small subunit ribosomal protein S16
LLKIRLARVGKKKQPTYRVVVADARAKRDGRYVEIVGSYNPRTEPTTFVIDEDKVKDWLAKGAQPTMVMHKLLARQGLMQPPVFPEPKAKAAPAPAARPAAASAPAATAVAEPEPVAEAEPVAAAEAEEAAGDAAEEAAGDAAEEESEA